MPRGYVCNVIFTKVGQDFQDWVNTRCQERNDRLAVEKDLNIDLDPRIFKAYKESTFVSRRFSLISLFSLHLNSHSSS